VSFIDNIIIGTEGEEGYNELVEEVVRRLVENNLYMKPEKCKWKVRKVEFLGVMIGPEGIKTEKDKMKKVLDWLIPRCVKNVQKFLGLVNYYCRFYCMIWSKRIRSRNGQKGKKKHLGN